MFSDPFAGRSRSGSFNKSGSFKSQQPSSSSFVATSASIRETGIIDKLMQSFGFITCCERNESIFFHFSQYNGSASELSSGDEVEFEVGVDSRTGKLIARRLVLLPTGTVSFESISEERLLGKVDCEPKIISIRGASPSERDGPARGSKVKQTYNDPMMGRIIYERSGEVFFVPYTFTDVNDERDIRKGDEVSFYMAKNKRTGALKARLVRLVQPAKVETVQGIVKTMKDSFGFIERADLVKDIFFHYSEVTGESSVEVGSCVEFVVQNRQGKDVAANIQLLSAGSVQFDEVAGDFLQGVVKKPVIRSFTHGRGKETESTQGEVTYMEDMDGVRVLSYSDTDQVGDFTMLSGDIVNFSLAIDKRDGTERATGVRLHRLVEEQKDTSQRETGVVAALRDGFGFIKCAQRDMRMFFHFNEVIDLDHKLAQYDEVEFSVQNDYTNERLHAVRIKVIPLGTVKFELCSNDVYTGSVEEELPGDCPRNQPSVHKIQSEGDSGTIRFLGPTGDVEVVKFYWSSDRLQFGDQVEFQVATRSYDNLVFATDVRVVQKAKDIKFRGFVATLKDSYGFIESEEHDCELFFPFTSCNGFCDPHELKVMDEVEYGIVRKNSKLSADEITKLPQGTIQSEALKQGQYNGVVEKPMKSTDNALDYEGIIKPTGGDGPSLPPQLPFSATSLADHRVALAQGDTVQFRVGVCPHSDTMRAVNVQSCKKFLRGTVETIKGEYGFITCHGSLSSRSNSPTSNGESIFFHMKSVETDFTALHSGDEVEFLLVSNSKSKKNSASHVKKLSANERPERLRRKQVTPRAQAPMNVSRQPIGPDSSGGFAPRTFLPSPALNRSSNVSPTPQ
ncbi:cold shock domain-containing protein E1-like [Halichondria panicea]|uniref:cold shock domain-containing protein E1-like n=1 Tax=Halichondria panicea TaxID=6063 RepID=UPI00312B5C56